MCCLFVANLKRVLEVMVDGGIRNNYSCIWIYVHIEQHVVVRYGPRWVTRLFALQVLVENFGTSEI